MGLPLLGIVLTVYQLPMVTSHLGAQQFRTVVASFDILLATFTSNAVVIGFMLQDRGYKKEKYKYAAQNTKRNDGGTLRPTTRWGSDEDLMRPSELSEDGKGGVVIGLRELGRSDSKKSMMPELPPKAKFPEIRVANTWEIQIEGPPSAHD
jgi:hypothetical protein